MLCIKRQYAGKCVLRPPSGIVKGIPDEALGIKVSLLFPNFAGKRVRKNVYPVLPGAFKEMIPQFV